MPFDFLKRTWDQTVGKDSYIGSGQASRDIEKGVKKVGKNIEQNLSGTLNEIAYAISTGDFSNLDQTFLNAGMAYATGGASLLLDPGATNYKETNIERATREAGERAEAEQREIAAAQERERLSGIASILGAAGRARRQQPGMSQTLLGSTSGNTLLSYKG